MTRTEQALRDRLRELERHCMSERNRNNDLPLIYESYDLLDENEPDDEMYMEKNIARILVGQYSDGTWSGDYQISFMSVPESDRRRRKLLLESAGYLLIPPFEKKVRETIDSDTGWIVEEGRLSERYPSRAAVVETMVKKVIAYIDYFTEMNLINRNHYDFFVNTIKYHEDIILDSEPETLLAEQEHYFAVLQQHFINAFLYDDIEFVRTGNQDDIDEKAYKTIRCHCIALLNQMESLRKELRTF